MSKAVGAIVLVFCASVAWSEEVTIAALGDSLTQGYGLPAEQGFVPQLEQWLQDQGQDATVINAGVSGDTTAGGLSRVDWTLTPDVDALIVTLGGNDLLRGIDPEVSRANLDGILNAASRAGVEVLLVGMQAPGNYGPEYKAAFDSMYPDLAEAYGTFYAESFFEGLGGAGTDPATLGDFMQADGIHPNASGVARIVEGLGPFVLDLARKAE
ncbi:arylesterase [Tateyamaria sp. Alg231-49]|uniref:arylesterase n=1 Tax=Tateyamaria sp. Alg231-49 TaxID=1922219 RepID=UPI000D550615|nr:arylesterase [Tateyamaria sp. Alg231-49]